MRILALVPTLAFAAAAGAATLAGPKPPSDDLKAGMLGKS